MEQQTNVEAGELLEKAAQLLTKGLSKLFKSNDQVADSKAIEKEGKVGTHYKLWLKDHPNGTLIVDIFPVKEKEDTWYIENVEFSETSKSGKVPKNASTKWNPVTVPGNKLMDTLQEFLNKELRLSGQIGRPDTAPDEDTSKLGQGSEDDEVAQDEYSQDTATFDSTQISAKLVKITSSKSVDLIGINSNTSPKATMDTLRCILGSDEIMSMFTDDVPLAIQITDDGDEYDINVIDDVDTSDTFKNLFERSVEFVNNLYAIHWACADTEVDASVNQLLWTAQQITDKCAKYRIEFEKVYPNPGCCNINCVDVSSGLSKQSALSLLLKITSEFVDVLDLYYVNVEHDIQFEIDSWMRDLKNQSEVTIATKMIQ